MIGMKELIYNLFSLSTLFALACALITDKRFEGVMRLCFSVIFSSVIFLGVGEALSDGAALPEDTVPELSELPTPFCEVVREATREGLVRSLCQEFSLSREDVYIELEEGERGEYLPRGVSITLSGKAVLADYRAMEEYLYEGGYESVRIKLSLDS